MSTFGEKIRICRRAFDMTQDQLAERLDTTKQVVSRYEAGLRIPKITTANGYSKALNVPLTFLMSPKTDLVVWEEDYVEDYFNAKPDDRLMLVRQRGIDPRIAADYANIYTEKSATISDDGLSEKKRRYLESLKDMDEDALAVALAAAKAVAAQRDK